MIDLLVIGNPTIDYIEGKFLGPGGPVTYISNSLAQLGQNKIDIVTSFGKDFSEVKAIESPNANEVLQANFSSRTTK